MAGCSLAWNVPSASTSLIVDDEGEALVVNDAAVSGLAARIQGQVGILREDGGEVKAGQSKHMRDRLQFLLCSKPLFSDFRKCTGPGREWAEIM